MDHETLSAELLQALRGRRSQRHLSARLGYASNVVYRWESQRCWPAAEVFFGLLQRVGVSPDAPLAEFFGRPFALPKGVNIEQRAAIPYLLRQLMADTPIGVLAERMGRSRFVVSRWLTGDTALRLPELLAFVEACTLRLLDFIAVFVDPRRLPAARGAWVSLEASRRAAYDMPWSHAVLLALELDGYRKLAAHDDTWIGAYLGIPATQVEECLKLLHDASQIRREGRHWVVTPRTIDTRRDPARFRQLRQFWSEVAVERQRSETAIFSAYNLCSLSDADYQQLQQLQRKFFSEMRQLVSRSTPSEKVVLVALQMVPLDGAP